jgi:hypothetical protein
MEGTAKTRSLDKTFKPNIDLRQPIPLDPLQWLGILLTLFCRKVVGERLRQELFQRDIAVLDRLGTDNFHRWDPETGRHGDRTRIEILAAGVTKDSDTVFAKMLTAVVIHTVGSDTENYSITTALSRY